MPATEQTWYNQKLLHVIFACTSVALLIATIWMLAADHAAEWKGHQRKFRSIEERMTGWREQQEADATQTEHERLAAELLTVRSTVPDRELVQQFQREVNADAERRGESAFDFGRLDALLQQLDQRSHAAAEVRQKRDELQTKTAKVDALVRDARAGLQKAQQSGGQASRRAAAERLAKTETVAQQAHRATEQAQSRVLEAESSAAAVRQEWLDGMTEIVSNARFREDRFLEMRKFQTAEYDAARASLDLGIRDARSQDEIDALQAVVTDLKEGEGGVDELNLKYQAAADHRSKLRALMEQITQRETELQEAMKENRAELSRLNVALQERQATYLTSGFPFLGKKILELPIIDAFNSPLKIDNLWTENLTIENGSFGQVRRFDRCTTCHKAIDKAMPGTADSPAYVGRKEIALNLATPATAPTSAGGTDNGKNLTLEAVYGFRLADDGLIDNDDVTVNRVASGSLAATARVVQTPDAMEVDDGLQVGDVIVRVNDDDIQSAQQVRRLLLTTVTWGQPVTLTVYRGLPHPYTSHPRLDLYVGSLSPHKLSVMGCSVCHDGQGSATEFKWASHTPNTPEEADQWSRDYGWFNNHHWIFPMHPTRFAESACLKCHHEVTELEPSERFPDPPAPKLMRGYNLVREFGCNGCHEINGYDGPKRIGPDMRLEPNYFAAAAQLRSDPGFAGLSAEQQGWANDLVERPELDRVRRRLRELILADAQSDSSVLTPESHKLADVLDDVEHPGRFRKAGPSLRYVSNKVGPEFLFDWVQQPNRFRPTTRMPQFFGLWDHLDGAGREVAERNEPIEVLGIVTYLLEKSKTQPWTPVSPELGIDESTLEEQIARGKLAFELRGCLACHSHSDFPGHEATQGPDLSNLGDKLSASGSPDGHAWLYSWLKSPNTYHARTKMPDLLLDPITDEDGKTTDPAADITQYLLASSNGWKPSEQVSQYIQQPDTEALDAVALEHLGATFFRRDAQQYLDQGIPESMRASLKGPEVELVGKFQDQQDARHKKLLYIGRKTISKAGCFACHDIPGFEDAKPIGTALTDWGRKEPSKLAFEHVVEYLHEHGHAHSGPASDGAHGGPPESGSEDTAAPDHADSEFDESFYHQRLEQHDRVGFIWQKLKEPRSYDFKKTENKGYLERLRMPQFPLNDPDREAIVTFVLGLVADPPADEFLYHPDPRTKAIVEGQHVLDKFNCGGCHVLRPERWDLVFRPGEIRTQPSVEDYPFVAPHYAPEQIEASLQPDPLRGTLHATVEGMPSINNDDGSPIVLDEEGDPIEDVGDYDPELLQYRFDLWSPTVIEGNVYQPGVVPLTVPTRLIKQRRPTLGGDLAKALVPRVIELERQVNPAAKGTEAWGWLPPPLHDLGRKVRSDWLHSFLLDPHMIRPAVVMRMPRFNMSSDEATKLVNYFAAKDNMEFPFEFDERARDAHLAVAEQAYRERRGNGGDGSSSPTSPTDQLRFDDAMKIVTDGNYCVKCHLVGDFEPEGSDRAKAPDLSRVYHRLRPEIVRKWIANPTRILPYTSMPVNVQYDPDAPNLGGVSQDLYHGTSVEQLDALVDLLMNYDRYTSGRSLISPLVKQASPPTDTDAAPGAATGAGGE